MVRPRRVVVGAILRLALVGLAVALLVAGMTRLPEALAGVDAFRVRTVEVEGLRYATREDVVAAAGIPPDASVWDDPAAWEAAVRRHPLVRGVAIERRLPATLRLRIRERQPVALVATPTLEPVDRDGRVLPIDPAVHPLDLPILLPPDGAGVGEGRDPVRMMAGVAARLDGVDPSFLGLVSELRYVGPGQLVARWGPSGTAVRFEPPLTAHRIREAVTVLDHAADRSDGRAVARLDLRWADQVVVEYR